MQNFLPRQLVVNLIQLYQCGLKAAGYQKKKKKRKSDKPFLFKQEICQHWKENRTAYSSENIC